MLPGTVDHSLGPTVQVPFYSKFIHFKFSFPTKTYPLRSPPVSGEQQQSGFYPENSLEWAILVSADRLEGRVAMAVPSSTGGWRTTLPCRPLLAPRHPEEHSQSCWRYWPTGLWSNVPFYPQHLIQAVPAHKGPPWDLVLLFTPWQCCCAHTDAHFI